MGIKTTVKRLVQKLPGKPYIFLESYPDLCDNTRPVFDELLERGYGKKYRFVWWVKDSKAKLPAFPGTRYVDNKTRWGKIKMRWYGIRSKCMICCNQFLYPEFPEIPSFYLTHGTTVKNLPGYHVPADITYTLVAGEGVREFMAAALHGDISRFHALGYPRNDILTRTRLDMHRLFEGEFDKVAVWYPTYRQHKNGKLTDCGNSLPIIHDADRAAELNRVAKELGILIVLKPHFAQDVSSIRDHGLSNIRLIDDDFFKNHGISSYEFVGSCDALISDYSSIYYDWLLCDKPVALVWEDIESYRKNPGFAVDLDFYMKGAEKIYTPEDFVNFLQHLAAGEDVYGAQRREINALVNVAPDGSTARVTDFIVEKANL